MGAGYQSGPRQSRAIIGMPQLVSTDVTLTSGMSLRPSDVLREYRNSYVTELLWRGRHD